MECKTEKPDIQRDQTKHEACFERATQVWLAVDHNTSVTSGEMIQCSKRIARASELGSCQSNLCFYEVMNGCKNLEIHEGLALKMLI